jgi:hypothetical protein
VSDVTILGRLCILVHHRILCFTTNLAENVYAYLLLGGKHPFYHQLGGKHVCVPPTWWKTPFLPPTWRKTGFCSPQLPHSPKKCEHLCPLRPGQTNNSVSCRDFPSVGVGTWTFPIWHTRSECDSETGKFSSNLVVNIHAYPVRKSRCLECLDRRLAEAVVRACGSAGALPVAVDVKPEAAEALKARLSVLVCSGHR